MSLHFLIYLGVSRVMVQGEGVAGKAGAATKSYVPALSDLFRGFLGFMVQVKEWRARRALPPNCTVLHGLWISHPTSQAYASKSTSILWLIGYRGKTSKPALP